ncbi:hypothetical protein Lser_V15G03504 [Lactuca serriola]
MVDLAAEEADIREEDVLKEKDAFEDLKKLAAKSLTETVNQLIDTVNQVKEDENAEQATRPSRGQNRSGAPLKAADNVIISQHQHAAASQIQARETNIHALSLSLPDKKEAILKELKLVNDSLSSHKNETGVPMNVSESFKKEYAMVLLQLKEASDQVASALANLRRRNTYPGILMPTWQKPNPDSGPVVDPTTSNHENNFPSNNNNQLASNVIGILKSSRNEAHKLVHTALQR